MSRAHSPSGMTLLELVVALAVGGMALAAGGAAFAFLSDRRVAMMAEADRDGRALSARRALEHWFSEVWLAPDGRGTAFRGIDGTRRAHEGELADDEVSFLTAAPTPLGGDATLVRLFVARLPGSDDGALVAEFRDARPGAARRVTLAEGVAGFDARFYTQAFGRTEWLDSWASGTLLPGAVELRLVAAAGDSLPAALRLPITIPFANGR